MCYTEIEVLMFCKTCLSKNVYLFNNSYSKLKKRIKYMSNFTYKSINLILYLVGKVRPT